MSEPCQNGGTCVSLYEKNSNVCLCKKGYTGSVCQTGKRTPIARLMISSIAKLTKSKNRMQIADFPAGLSQPKRFVREIPGIRAKFSFHKCFRNSGFCHLKNLKNHPPFQFVCLSLV